METHAAAMRAKILPLLVLLVLAGCSSFPSLLYRIDIQQGNAITQEMVDKLKPGMTRSQVRFVLGSPMISDAFHDNRWDYVFRLEQKGELVEQRQLTVFFEGDKLQRIDGSFPPSIAFAPPQPVEPTPPIVKEESGTPASSGTLALPEPMPSLRQAPLQATIQPQAIEPIKPAMKEDSSIPMSSGIPPPSGVAASTGDSAPDVPVAGAVPVVSNTPVQSESSTRNTRRMPSQAVDAGGKEADQPKE